MFSRGRAEAWILPVVLFLTVWRGAGKARGWGSAWCVFACYFRLSLALSLRVSSLPFPILSFFVSDVGMMLSLLSNCKD